MKLSLLPPTPPGSWKRILGRPRWSCPPDTAHSQMHGQFLAWTLGQCSWYHRDPSLCVLTRSWLPPYQLETSLSSNPSESKRPEKKPDATSEEHEVCCQTSLLCSGCKMEAERKDREIEEGEDATKGDKMERLFHLNSPVHTASQTVQCRGPTSPLLHCMGALEWGTQESHRMYV